eukprot:gene30607-34745_t
MSSVASACWFTGFASAPVALVRIVGQIEVAFTMAFAHFYLGAKTSRGEIAGLALVAIGVVLALIRVRNEICLGTTREDAKPRAGGYDVAASMAPAGYEASLDRAGLALGAGGIVGGLFAAVLVSVGSGLDPFPMLIGFLVGAVITAMTVVAIGGPVWIVCHALDRRGPVSAVSVGAFAGFALFLGGQTYGFGIFAMPSEDTPTLLYRWMSAIATSLVMALVSALIGGEKPQIVAPGQARGDEAGGWLIPAKGAHPCRDPSVPVAYGLAAGASGAGPAVGASGGVMSPGLQSPLRVEPSVCIVMSCLVALLLPSI